MLQDKIDIEGTEIFYSSWGAQNPAKMIFIHDNPGSSADLHPANIKSLSQNFHVVVFDRAGHGESTFKKIDFETTRASVSRIAEILKFESFVLLAHSWGSLFAFDYTNHFPNKVESLFLVNPISFEVNQSLNFPAELIKIPGAFYFLKSKMERQWRDLLKRKYSPSSLPSETLHRLSKKQALSFSLEERLLASSIENFKTIYSKMEKRVLILATKDDQYVKWEDQADKLYQILPDSNIVLEPHGGHSIISLESRALIQASRLIQKESEKRMAHA
jgi:pimeloyl-ACP methyl ester carboxylesterase